MNKVQLICGSLVIMCTTASASQAWDQIPPRAISACQVASPYGLPQSKTQGVAICRSAYATFVDMSAKIPVWVEYTLDPKNAIGCVARSNAFAPDASLPKGQRAELADYAKSGFDIGHNAPDGDMSFNDVSEHESFILSNMSPQYPSTNRGDWKLLESSVRGWAYERNHLMLVYAGNVYGPDDKTIGADKVVIPHALYKVVVDTVTNEMAGWVIPNVSANGGNDLTKYREKIADISSTTGVSFPLPKNGVELATGKEWSVDFGAFTKAKKAKCGGSGSDE